MKYTPLHWMSYIILQFTFKASIKLQIETILGYYNSDASRDKIFAFLRISLLSNRLNNSSIMSCVMYP
jgi:hypothetical protein